MGRFGQVIGLSHLTAPYEYLCKRNAIYITDELHLLSFEASAIGQWIPGNVHSAVCFLDSRDLAAMPLYHPELLHAPSAPLLLQTGSLKVWEMPMLDLTRTEGQALLHENSIRTLTSTCC